MVTIHDSIGKWPFPLVTELRHKGSRDWVEIDQERADYFLGVLPPIYFKGGFFVSEPAAHVTIDGREVPVYGAVAEMDGRHFMREFPYTLRECADAIRDLRVAVYEDIYDCPIHGTSTADGPDSCARC